MIEYTVKRSSNLDNKRNR